MTSTVIDAEGLVLGRLASTVAKRLLAGETIDILNAQGVVVSGSRTALVNEWKEFIKVGGFGKGPTHNRRPDNIVRRAVRGMLPYRIPKGAAAYKRLTVHIGIPEKLAVAEKTELPGCSSSKLNHRFVTVGDLAVEIGWNRKGVD